VPKHGGCAACGSREEETLVSSLAIPDLAAKMKCYSVAVCSKCINMVELTKGGTRG
jgi:hypothetical protein